MLKAKRILITGASRGIGREIALKCAAAGADVGIIYAGNEAAAAETAQQAASYNVKAFTYKLDVSDFTQAKTVVESAAKDMGGIDGLVNNAGVTADKLLLRMSEADYDKVLNVNLKGTFNMIKHVSALMLRAKYGHIVNMSSVIGLMGNAGQVNYAASKAGIIGITKSVAKELSSRGITCNAVAPGFIDTDMTSALTLEQKDAITKMIPLGVIGKPDDVANLVVFLLSDSARYITGECIKVDGGMYI